MRRLRTIVLVAQAKPPIQDLGLNLHPVLGVASSSGVGRQRELAVFADPMPVEVKT